MTIPFYWVNSERYTGVGTKDFGWITRVTGHQFGVMDFYA